LNVSVLSGGGLRPPSEKLLQTVRAKISLKRQVPKQGELPLPISEKGDVCEYWLLKIEVRDGHFREKRRSSTYLPTLQERAYEAVVSAGKG
jgi:hypothetical protein